MGILLNLNSARFRERGRDIKMLCKNETNSCAKKETVNHPNHYQSVNGLEVIDVMESFTEDLKGIEAVDTTQIIKYICRWDKKNGLEDLKRAMWYLNHLIDLVEEKENGSIG